MEMMFDTPERRWRALQTRDKRAHSAFIYGVTTTRIYCRPTCPARLARRANVVFFDTPIDASASSYRPCKRCKPDQETAVLRASQLVQRAQRFILDQRGQVTLDNVADHLGISSRYLHHIFTREVACTPAAYALKCKTASLATISAASTSTSTSLTTATTSTTVTDASQSMPSQSPDSVDISLGLDISCPDQMPRSSDISTDLWNGSWSDFGDVDFFSSTLSHADAQLLWQNYEQSLKPNQDGSLWDLVDFDAQLFDTVLTDDVVNSVPPVHQTWSNK